MTPDDLVERVARLYEDKWGVTDHGLARAAIAVALEEAARVCEYNAAALDHPSVYMGGPSNMAKMKAGFFAAAIRALIPKEDK